jgi:hypothetical protein
LKTGMTTEIACASFIMCSRLVDADIWYELWGWQILRANLTPS